jgi:hypothetical protein
MAVIDITVGPNSGDADLAREWENLLAGGPGLTYSFVVSVLNTRNVGEP